VRVMAHIRVVAIVLVLGLLVLYVVGCTSSGGGGGGGGFGVGQVCDDDRPCPSSLFCYETQGSQGLCTKECDPSSASGCPSGTTCSSAKEVCVTSGNTCQYAFDGECDQPDLCDSGTDTTDCAGVVDNTCKFAFDGECDEPELCPSGSDSSDCAGLGGNTCEYAFDGECDEPNLCPPGTDSSDCG
jgi:hypothetical protein